MTTRANYPTLITLDTATPIAAGRMFPDGRDIRVYSDAAHTQALPFYVENINSAETKLWVKADHPTGRYHPDILAYWRLDGNATDDVGGFDGTLTNSPSPIIGQVGAAYDFDSGSNEHIELTQAFASEYDNRSEASFECWFRRGSTGANHTIYQITGASNFTKFQVEFNSSDQLRIRARTNTGDSLAGFTTTNTFIDTLAWHHLVATIDVNNVLGTIWVDGVAEAVTGTPTYANNTFLAGNFINSNYIGQSDTGIGEYDGGLDNCAAYLRVLTSDEVRSSYLRGLAGKQLSEPQPAAHWTFNSIDNAGSEVVDLISGDHGTIIGNPSVGQQGRIGQSFVFDGTSDYIKVTDNSNFTSHLGSSGTLTLATTVAVPDNPGATVLFSIDDVGPADGEITLAIGRGTTFNGSAEDHIFLIIHKNGSSDAAAWYRWDTLVSYPLGNKPHHIVAWYDNTEPVAADKGKIYIDGIQIPVVFDDRGSGSASESSVDPIIAGRENSGSPANPLDGKMHDFLWSDSALSDEQIAGLASRSKQGLRPDLTDPLLDISHYWSLDNVDIGIDPQDISGSEYHVTNNTSVNVGKEGIVGNAIDLSGSSSGFDLPSTIASDLDGSPGATIATWIKLDTIGGSSQNIFVITASGGNGKLDMFVTTSGEILTGGRSQAADSAQRVTTVPTLSTGVWHHVVSVVDIENDEVLVYFNGQQVSTTGAIAFGLSAFNADTGTTHVIGNPTGTSIDGLMSNLEIYFERLTASQISDLYEKGKASSQTSSSVSRVFVTYGNPNLSSSSSKTNTFTSETTGLVAAYEFDEQNGNNVLDKVGSNNGVIDGYVLVTTGQFGLARRVEGEGALDFPSQIIPTGNASIVMTLRTDLATQVLAANYNGNANNRGSALETEDGYFVYRNAIGAGSDNVFIKGTIPIDDGTFHTIIVTKTSTTATIYIDGVIDGTDTFVGAETLPATSNFRIGGYVGLFSANATFDDLRVFNSTISSSAVADLSTQFGEVSGNSVLVRTRLDPDPISRNTGTTVTSF